jgi:all-trans-8'-apo-beta-carotenal 15,15'-oxygenase
MLGFAGFVSAAVLQDRQAIMQPQLQTQVWDAGSRRYVNEPLFVPKPHPTAEDDGWILAILHNGETDRGELVILDAQRVADGPLATVRLPHHLAAGLHGSFSPKLLLKGWEEAAGRDWRQANVVRQV